MLHEATGQHKRRYPKKRLTAPYLESSFLANIYSQGKTPDCRLFPPWELAFWDTYHTP